MAWTKKQHPNSHKKEGISYKVSRVKVGVKWQIVRSTTYFYLRMALLLPLQNQTCSVYQ